MLIESSQKNGLIVRHNDDLSTSVFRIVLDENDLWEEKNISNEDDSPKKNIEVINLKPDYLLEINDKDSPLISESKFESWKSLLANTEEEVLDTKRTKIRIISELVQIVSQYPWSLVTLGTTEMMQKNFLNCVSRAKIISYYLHKLEIEHYACLIHKHIYIWLPLEWEQYTIDVWSSQWFVKSQIQITDERHFIQKGKRYEWMRGNSDTLIRSTLYNNIADNQNNVDNYQHLDLEKYLWIHGLYVEYKIWKKLYLEWKCDQAKEYFDMSIESHPKFPLVYYELINYHIKNGDMAKAYDNLLLFVQYWGTDWFDVKEEDWQKFPELMKEKVSVNTNSESRKREEMNLQEISWDPNLDIEFLSKIFMYPWNLFIDMLKNIFYDGKIRAHKIHELQEWGENSVDKKNIRNYIEAFLQNDQLQMKSIIVSVLETIDDFETTQQSFDF